MYMHTNANPVAPWNKGKIVGQKPPLKIKAGLSAGSLEWKKPTR